MRSKKSLAAAAAVIMAVSSLGLPVNANAQEIYFESQFVSYDASANSIITDYTSIRIPISAIAKSGAKGYIAECTSQKMDYITAKASANYLTIKNLAPGKRYTFMLYAAIGDKYYKIARCTASTAAIPKVTGVKVSDRTSDTTISTSATLSWNKIDGVTGYEVYRIVDGIPKRRNIVETNTPSVTITGLKAGNDEKFVVKAYVESGGTIARGTQSSTVTVHCRPQTPLVDSLAGDSSVTVGWTKSTGAQGYNIYMSEKKNSDFKLVATKKNPDTLKTTVKNLKSGKTYYFRVRAYRKIGSTKYCSEYSEITAMQPIQYVTVQKQAKLYSSAAFSQSSITTLKKGKKVVLLGKSGRWYKVKVGDKKGYVYNLAFGKSSNVDQTAAVSESNIDAVIDDALFNYGTSPKEICSFVASRINYMTRPALANSKAYAVSALRYGRGNCYYFAGLSDYMLERAGFKNRYIVAGGSNFYSNSSHRWNLYKGTDGKWHHFDACYRNFDVGTFYAWTDAQVSRYFWWTRSNYPAAK